MDALDRYQKALADFVSARASLSDALHELHKTGVYPSPPNALRFPLPDERPSITVRTTFRDENGPLDVYLTAGHYTDGQLGELFLEAGKGGHPTVAGLLDTVSILFSVTRQFGAPLQNIVRKLERIRFEPSQFGRASSIPDYLAKWIQSRYLKQSGVE